MNEIRWEKKEKPYTKECKQKTNNDINSMPIMKRSTKSQSMVSQYSLIQEMPSARLAWNRFEGGFFGNFDRNKKEIRVLFIFSPKSKIFNRTVLPQTWMEQSDCKQFNIQ